MPDEEAAHTNPSLSSLANELTHLADQLRDIQSGRDGKTFFKECTQSAQSNTGDSKSLSLLEVAQTRYFERRNRVAIFGHPELFGEPAWDILLDLYIAHARGKTVSVSSACIGANVPATTALRWLGLLEEVNLVTREHDPLDQRRVLVRLTQDAVSRMEKFLTGHQPPDQGGRLTRHLGSGHTHERRAISR